MTASVPADPVVIPGWLRRLGALSWRLLAISALAAVTIWLSVLLGTVTVSVLLSLVVAASFAPMVGRLRARGWSKTKSSALATTLFFLIGLIVLLVMVLAFVPDLVNMVRAIQSGVDELRASWRRYRLTRDRCPDPTGGGWHPRMAGCGDRRNGRGGRIGGDRRDPLPDPHLLRPQ